MSTQDAHPSIFQRKKAPLLAFSVFFIVGLIFVVVGSCIFFINSHFKQTAKETTATIVDIQTERRSQKTSHNVYVDFTAEGKEYTHEPLGYYSSGMQNGDKIPIYYDPEDPRELLTSGHIYFLPGMFFFMGSIFAIIGGYSIYRYWRSYSLEKRLRQVGLMLRATVEKCEINHRIAVNGRNPFQFTCTVDDERYAGKQFVSENLYDNPPSNPIGASINVYVDKNNSDIYFVDSFSLSVNPSILSEDTVFYGEEY